MIRIIRPLNEIFTRTYRYLAPNASNCCKIKKVFHKNVAKKKLELEMSIVKTNKRLGRREHEDEPTLVTLILLLGAVIQGARK